MIVKFHHWPNKKQRKEVVEKLKVSGLKKTKSIKSFEMQLFEWSEGGLQSSNLAERACNKLKDLSYVKRCSPDHLLPLDDQRNSLNPKSLFSSASTDSKTEAGFIEHCPSCRKENSISPVPLNIRTCNLVSHERGLVAGKVKSGGEGSDYWESVLAENLSDYWAQELIGSDLLREELENTPPPERENWIAVFDSPRNDHYIHVKNLISDEGPHAVLPELGKERNPYFQTNAIEKYQSTLSLFETGFPGDYISHAHYLRKRPPHFINNSMGWRESEDIYEVFEKLSPPAIVVVSAGNSFSEENLENMQSKSSKNFDTILVGSFSPTGFVSEFSNSDKEVHIMAPSDVWISSVGKNGEHKIFGGTSGAAPLVTGSLAGFEWLSGYHPTSEEAKILLEKTATPTLHSHEEPPVNGAGLLNAYKLGEVAKRLKQKCKGKSLFCFKEGILNDENYHFDLNKLDKNLKRDLSKAFPDCITEKKPANSSELPNCEEKGEVFKRLRKAILLNPKESKEFLKSLSCIYREGDFSQNAKALDKLALSLDSKEDVRTSVKAMARKEEPISDETLRLMIGMGGFEEEFQLFNQKEAIKMAGHVGEAGLPIAEKAFDTDDYTLKLMAVRAAGNMGEVGFPLVEKAFDTNDNDSFLKREAVEMAGNMGEVGLPVVNKAFDTGNRDLQRTAIRVAGNMGEIGFPLVEEAYHTNDIGLQIRAVEAAGNIGKSGLPLVEEAFDTGNSDLQFYAVEAAGNMGEVGLPVIRKGFAVNDPYMRDKSVEAAGNTGKAGLPLVKEAFHTDDIGLQLRAVESAGKIGKPGLPLIEKAFNTKDEFMQVMALQTMIDMREPALPLLRKASQNKNLDQYVREGIKSHIQEIEKEIGMQ